MKRAALLPLWTIAVVLFGGCSTGKDTHPTPLTSITPPPDMQILQGKLLNQIGRLEKDMPRAGSEGFVAPTDAEKNTFSAILTTLRNNELETALAQAKANGYELLWYTDQNDNNSTNYLLRELDTSRKGWGLYVFRVATRSNVIVEAPHPLYDEGTPALAVAIYRALDARALLVAGAHRDANKDGSADTAHSPQTIFQAIHAAELAQSIHSTGSVVVLQIHGFAASKHPAYPHVIVSFENGGNLDPAEFLRGQQLETKIFHSLRQQGVDTGACGGGQWRDLCGSTTIQASLMTHGIFIHLEVDESVRDKDQRFLAALSDTLAFGQ